MAFPFLPFGALLAALILIAALSIFGLALRAIDRTLVGLRDTMVSGLVSGFRTWSQARPPRQIVTSSPSAAPSPSAASSPRSSGGEIIDLETRGL